MGASISGAGASTLNLVFVTVKDSVAGSGADADLPAIGPYAQIHFFYSVLDNPAMDDCSEYITVSSVTDSVSADASCTDFPEASRNVAVDLGPLQDNGGPTLTHMPGAASPLLNAVSLEGQDCPVPAFASAETEYEADDQRGTVRPVGAGCDVGAVER